MSNEKRDAARERWLKDRFAKIETHIEAKRAYNAAWAARQSEIDALRAHECTACETCLDPTQGYETYAFCVHCGEPAA